MNTLETITYTVAFLASDAAAKKLGENVASRTLVAHAVGMETVHREREFTRLHAPKPEKVKESTKRLGCYVDGILRFQSRDHDAVREYADRKMRPITRRLSDGSYRVTTSNVWVAPVGSFVTED